MKKPKNFLQRVKSHTQVYSTARFLHQRHQLALKTTLKTSSSWIFLLRLIEDFCVKRFSSNLISPNLNKQFKQQRKLLWYLLPIELELRLPQKKKKRKRERRLDLSKHLRCNHQQDLVSQLAIRERTTEASLST